MSAGALGRGSVALLLGCAALAARAESGPPAAGAAGAHEVLVVGAADQSADELAAGLERLSAAELAALHLRGAADGVARLAGVTLNETQGNPFQPDVNLRGFTASPVLGTPQGLAVYVDGVRVNEAFGDTVNWDLIPMQALARLEELPGSDPAFGLNSLGGAIAVRTLRGLDARGGAASVEGGSFGRRGAALSHGGEAGRLDWFASGAVYDDPGWAAHAASRLRQGFGELGYRDARSDIALKLTLADNRLEGNQTLPRSLLADPSQAYTWPDRQSNRLLFVDLALSRVLAPGLRLAGNGWYRQLSDATANSNVNADYDPTRAAGAGNEPTGNALAMLGGYQTGLSVSLAGTTRWLGLTHLLDAGLNLERGHSSFAGFEQPAGASRDTESAAPALLESSLAASTRTAALYAADRLALGPRLTLALGLRSEQVLLALRDRQGTALNGDHPYASTRRSARLEFRPAPPAELYAGYSEGWRVPTPVELACADPAAPCSLPNAFAADPPLATVRSRTGGAGARLRLAPATVLELEVYRTDLADDIAFVSSRLGTSSGYFRTVGDTRRDGAGLGLEAGRGSVELRLRYDWLQARYRTPLTLPSPWNSSAATPGCTVCSDIAVPAGAQLPGLPRQLLKLRLGWHGAAAAAGLSLVAQSGQYARGDENNQDRNGPLPGFALLALDARLELAPRWRAWIRIDNLLDRRYSTFAVLGRNVFTAPGASFDPSGSSWRSEQFRSLAAPRSLALGLDWRLGPTGR